MEKVLEYALYFFIYAILGWCVEVIHAALKRGKFANRGFLNGCWCPIYGAGVVLVLLSLTPININVFVLFIASLILTSVLEFIVGFILEKLFKTKWWDYSKRKFNINGRICLRNSFAFGVLSIVIIYFVTPLFGILFGLFDIKVWEILAIVFFVLLLLDTIYSVVIAYNLRNRIIIVEELKNEKIALIPVLFEKRLRESIEGFKAFPNRLLKAFPDLERQNHKSFEIMKVYREQLKKKRKELKNNSKKHKNKN